MDSHFDTLSARLLFSIALSQSILGSFVTLYLYGRKVSNEYDDDDEDWDEDQDPYERQASTSNNDWVA
jgi:hypothetical protein